MKSDEDIWISHSTKASRPDELGPDKAAGVPESFRSDQRSQAERKGESQGD